MGPAHPTRWDKPSPPPRSPTNKRSRSRRRATSAWTPRGASARSARRASEPRVRCPTPARGRGHARHAASDFHVRSAGRAGRQARAADRPRDGGTDARGRRRADRIARRPPRAAPGVLFVDRRGRARPPRRSLLDIARRVRDAAQARFEAGAAPRLEVLQADLGVDARRNRSRARAQHARRRAGAAQRRARTCRRSSRSRVAGSLSDGVATIAYEQALTLASTSNVDLVASIARSPSKSGASSCCAPSARRRRCSPSAACSTTRPNSPSARRAGVSVELPLFSRNQGQIAAVDRHDRAAARPGAMRRAARSRTPSTGRSRGSTRSGGSSRPSSSGWCRPPPISQALAEESYRAGRTSVLGVLDAQRSLRDLTREALQAALDLQLSLADLEEILGTTIR